MSGDNGLLDLLRQVQARNSLVSPDEARLRAQLLQNPAGRAWFNDFAYDDPPTLHGGDYNYAEAMRQGAWPSPYAPDGGRYHWPSTAPNGAPLKAPDHPTAWMETFMQRYRTDPNVASPSLIQQGRAAGIVPPDWSRQ